MRLHISCVAIEGNDLAAMPGLFESCQYRVVDPVTTVSDGERVGKALEQRSLEGDRTRKVAFLQGSWTMIIDPELVMTTDEEVWIRLSSNHRTRVLCWVCEGVSATYEFILFEHGKKKRMVSHCDGDLSQSGTPLPEEAGFDWTKADEDSILRVAERLGARYDYLEARIDYQIYLLEYSPTEP